MNRSIRYDLSRFKDCTDQDGKPILAFTIRTTDGTDENYASKQAEARGTTMTEELIRFSLVSYETADGVHDVNGKTGPFVGFDKWATKARNFVVAAWKKLATPDELEIADFFKNATDVA